MLLYKYQRSLDITTAAFSLNKSWLPVIWIPVHTPSQTRYSICRTNLQREGFPKATPTQSGGQKAPGNVELWLETKYRCGANLSLCLKEWSHVDSWNLHGSLFNQLAPSPHSNMSNTIVAPKQADALHTVRLSHALLRSLPRLPPAGAPRVQTWAHTRWTALTPWALDCLCLPVLACVQAVKSTLQMRSQ